MDDSLPDIKMEVEIDGYDIAQLDVKVKTEPDDSCDIGFEFVTCEETNTKGDSVKYRCSFCSKIFSSKSQLSSHKLEMNHFKAYKCDVCKKEFTTDSDLTKHKEVHTWNTHENRGHVYVPIKNPNNMFVYKCSFCPATFDNAPEFESHKVKMRHFKQYKCKICWKTFFKMSSLIEHEMLPPEKRCKVPMVMDKDGKEKPIIFLKTSSLNNDEILPAEKRCIVAEVMHKDEKEKPYVCEACGEGFLKLCMFKEHKVKSCPIAKSTFEKPFVCKICSKAFAKPVLLRYHMRTHTGERPYSCPMCPKTFGWSNALKVHVRRHNGDHSHHCKLCGKGFYDTKSLTKHNKIHDKVA